MSGSFRLATAVQIVVSSESLPLSCSWDREVALKQYVYVIESSWAEFLKSKKDAVEPWVDSDDISHI